MCTNQPTRQWFRSADMEYVSLGIQEHCAHRVITELGRLGVIQFTDLNPEMTAFQRRYFREISRCDEMDRKVRYFQEMLEKFEIKAEPAPDLESFLDALERRRHVDTAGAGPPTAVLDDLEVLLENKEAELINLNGYGSSLVSDYNSKLELKHVLNKALLFARDEDIQGGHASAGSLDGMEEGTGLFHDRTMRFRFISGVVSRDDRSRFERMIFRSTRGNCYMRFAEIDDATLIDPATNTHVEKEVFIIFYQAAYIETKLKRICDAFGAGLYDIPDLENVAEIVEQVRQTDSELQEREHVIRKNKIDMETLLKVIAQTVERWKWTIKHEKTVYHTLNHFMADVSGVLRAEGWVVSSAREKVASTVRRVHNEMVGDSNHTLPSWVTTLPKSGWPKTVPTHFHLNRFTELFQMLVNTYGVPRYQEANPALFTVVTFPFLFGVMFGDIGHGLLLFIAALTVVRHERHIAKMVANGELHEILVMVFAGRYVLVLMGFFATFCGFIYNDCFGLGLELFTPTWILPDHHVDGIVTLNRTGPTDVYPLGIDPTWHIATNSILFFNSVKMKMAVVFGVSQMTFGLFLKFLNVKRVQQKKGEWNLDLYFEVIPQVIFMTALFGYMCFLIIYKWCRPWYDNEGCKKYCDNPPSLITMMINMALSPGTIAPKDMMFDNQDTIQLALLLVAMCMLPLMLIPKPYIIIKYRMKNHRPAPISESDSYSGVLGSDSMHDEHAPPSAFSHTLSDRSLSTESMNEGASLMAKSSEHAAAHGGGHGHDDDEEHTVGDILVHQSIETIEFALGCISNTASYLRLWALSLAHSQLAIVFWNLILLDNIKGATGPMGAIMAFVGYAGLAGVTFGVLMVMDNLECFLHSLRLHWIEFQGKFYSGDGVQFAPLSFKTSMTGEE